MNSSVTSTTEQPPHEVHTPLHDSKLFYESFIKEIADLKEVSELLFPSNPSSLTAKQQQKQQYISQLQTLSERVFRIESELENLRSYIEAEKQWIPKCQKIKALAQTQAEYIQQLQSKVARQTKHAMEKQQLQQQLQQLQQFQQQHQNQKRGILMPTTPSHDHSFNSSYIFNNNNNSSFYSPEVNRHNNSSFMSSVQETNTPMSARKAMKEPNNANSSFHNTSMNTSFNNISHNTSMNTSMNTSLRAITPKSKAMSVPNALVQHQRALTNIASVSYEEFSKSPGYLKGRMTYHKFTELMAEIQKACDEKYRLVNMPNKSKLNGRQSMIVKAHQETSMFVSSKEIDFQFQRFFTEHDVLELSDNFKLDQNGRNTLSLLRHLGRLKLVVGKDGVHRLVVSNGVAIDP